MALKDYEEIPQVIYEEGADYSTKGVSFAHLSVEGRGLSGSSKYLHEVGKLTQDLWTTCLDEIAKYMNVDPSKVPAKLPNKTTTI